MDMVTQSRLEEHIRLLNQAASSAMEYRTGAAADATALFHQAMDISVPMDTTALGHAVMTLVMRAGQIENSEAFLHHLFRDHVGKLIPGAQITTLQKDAVSIPDFMVEVNGVDMPVEIKDHPADAAALRQLERYIAKFSRSGRGYLVAPDVIVPLPEAVTFVKLDRQVRWALAGYAPKGADHE